MKSYDPTVAPDPGAWLALDEDERVDLVEAHHRRARISVPNLALHASIHTIVENQIAMGDELPVRRTVERLVREGLDRHDALHAVGNEVVHHMIDLMRSADPTPESEAGGSEEPAALARYKAAVERLTAKKWRASLEAEDDENEAWPQNIDDAIGDLKVSRDLLPDASMQWALDNWDQAAPRLLGMLDDYASGADRSDGTANALFPAIHMLAEKRETRAFAALCKLLEDPEGAEEVLGDAITENLSCVLIATFDGDRLALRRVVEAPDAEPFVRHAAFEAMAYLTRTGRIPDDETRAYLGHLRQVMEPRGESPAWDGWASAVANLGYADYEGEVETLLRLGYIDPMAMDMDWFRDRLSRVLADPEGFIGFVEDGVQPFEDAIGTLSWPDFPDEDDLGDEPDAEPSPWPAAEQPVINPVRHIGRNDPCPCGSGKKYKKCCLR